MNRLKNFLSILFLMAIFSFILPAAAMNASAGDNPGLAVQKVYGKTDQQVEVSVLISNNTGIAGATIQLKYDERLTLIDAANGEAFQSLSFTKPAFFMNPCRFLWDSESGMATADGAILKLLFQVPGDADSNEQFPIEVSYVDGDIFDENLDDVTLTTEAGAIILSEEPKTEPSTEPETEPGETDTDSDSPLIFAENAAAHPGEVIDVALSIKNNPGIAGAVLKIEYDPQLILRNVMNGEAFADLTMTKPSKLSSPIKILWDSLSGQVDKNGVIATLEFEVASDAKADTKLGIQVSYETGDIYDEDFNDIPVKVRGGSVLVANANSLKPVITLMDDTVHVLFNSIENVVSKGIIIVDKMSDASAITLDTVGRIVIRFTGQNEDNEFTFHMGSLVDYYYRAFMIIKDESGKEEVLYSADVTGAEANELSDDASIIEVTKESDPSEKTALEEKKEQEAPTIQITVPEMPLQIRKAVSLTGYVTGLQEGDRIVSWNSDKPDTATVKDGVVTAGNKKGDAHITVTTEKGASASFTIHVKLKKVQTQELIVKEKRVYLDQNQKYKLTVERYPVTSKQKIVYKTADKHVASVSGKGVVKAKNKGKTTIQVKSGNVVRMITIIVQ